LVIFLYLVFVGGIVVFLTLQEKQRRLNCSPENLAKLIKTELTEEREEIKRGQKVKFSKYDLWYEENDEKDTEIYCSSGHFRKKTGRWLVKQTDLEKKDWDEIVSLIRQNRELRWDKKSEKNKKAREKLESSANPQLFYYWEKVPSKGFLRKGERRRYCFWFWDKEKNDTYDLLIPENHPALIKLSKGQYYLIEGIENIPYCQGFFGDEKRVKLTDKIVIKPC